MYACLIPNVVLYFCTGLEVLLVMVVIVIAAERTFSSCLFWNCTFKLYVVILVIFGLEWRRGLGFR